MKILPLLAIAAVLIKGTINGAENMPELEVHEWGTFTFVFGSDGSPIQWYQPQQALAELPDFVYPPRTPKMPSLKSAAPGFFSRGYYVRMETPVIYFYPQAPMRVSAEARMMNGLITEWFPNVTTGKMDGTMRWEGNLLPPSDTAALDKIPKADGPKGAHYAHAREVPDAWIFQGEELKLVQGVAKTAEKAKDAMIKEKGAPQPPEKFIFYRGAGDIVPPFSIMDSGNENLRLLDRDKRGSLEESFLIDVGKDGMRWTKLPGIPPIPDGQTSSEIGENLNRLPPAPAEEAGKQLAEAMQAALQKSGLTPDEAKAMVATWRDLWCTERGTRVLVILSRDWVDSVLPLKITPEPKKLTRVFVARLELFTGKREERVLALLSEGFPQVSGWGNRKQFEDTLQLTSPYTASVIATKPTEEEIYGPLLRELGLGRFANAALTRAQEIGSRKMSERFYELQKISEQMEKHSAPR